MSLPFLSPAWFDQMQHLREEASALLSANLATGTPYSGGLPDAVQQARLNITVIHTAGDKCFSIRQGDIHPGHLAAADTRITIDYDVACRMFREGDLSAGMQAFMAGQIRVEGNMSVLLMLQQHLAANLTAEQEALRQRALALTEM